MRKVASGMDRDVILYHRDFAPTRLCAYATKMPHARRVRDNPGCQGLSWPADLNDAELTHWQKDANNPLNVTNLPCGSRAKNSPGAFPGSIYQNGDH